MSPVRMQKMYKLNRYELREWAQGLIEGDTRVSWQRSEPITGTDIARIVRDENPEATDDDLTAIAEIINNN